MLRRLFGTTHEHTAKPHLSCMSDANREGYTPSPQQPYPQHNQPTAAAAAQQQGSATMMSGSFSVPIRAPASEEEERIQIAGSAGTVHVHDVLCGRGKVSFNHAGNKRFRESITKSLGEYRKAVTRSDKAAIVQRVIDEILNSGGRFLKKNQTTGEWYQLNEQQTKEKVSHAVRDAANTMDARKSQGKAKGKLKSARDKQDSLSLGLGTMPSFSPRGGLLGTSNFYDNLDRATREIRRQASEQHTSWSGVDLPYDPTEFVAMGPAAGERLSIPAMRDIQIPGEHQQTTSEADAHAQPGFFHGEHGSSGIAHDHTVHAASLSDPSIRGLQFHNAGHSGGRIVMPEPPRIGFASSLQPYSPPNISNREMHPAPSMAASMAAQQMILQQHSSEDSDQFLDRINDVLGPLPSGEDDPMKNYLGGRNRSRR